MASIVRRELSDTPTAAQHIPSNGRMSVPGRVALAALSILAVVGLIIGFNYVCFLLDPNKTSINTPVGQVLTVLGLQVVVRIGYYFFTNYRINQELRNLRDIPPRLHNN